MSAPSNTPIQSDVVARSFLWRWLAAAFTYPDSETWEWLQSDSTRRLLPESVPFVRSTLDARQSAYLSLFGHTVRGDCPTHELEYGELKADALYQPHRLADIAAFYSAFGLELVPDMADRVDHIAMECEFFSVLCAKELYALENDPTNLDFCRDAQRKFLREHLGRWTPAFARRLARLTNDKFYQSAAELLKQMVLAECARYRLQPGNADLQLRPVGEMVDACGSCGIPGAAFPGGGQEGE
jgi:putative dimethyl sulfoxide reductase chaperone